MISRILRSATYLGRRGVWKNIVNIHTLLAIEVSNVEYIFSRQHFSTHSLTIQILKQLVVANALMCTTKFITYSIYYQTDICQIADPENLPTKYLLKITKRFNFFNVIFFFLNFSSWYYIWWVFDVFRESYIVIKYLLILGVHIP